MITYTIVKEMGPNPLSDFFLGNSDPTQSRYKIIIENIYDCLIENNLFPIREVNNQF